MDDSDEVAPRRSNRRLVQSTLPFSPSKIRGAPTRQSTRNRRTVADDNYATEDEDEDEPMSEDWTPTKKKATKPRRKRTARPAYGFVRSTEDLDASDSDTAPLRAHRQTCEKCLKGPSHVLMVAARKKKNRGKKKRRGPDADLMESSADEVEKTEKLGGWVRCLKCPVSTHWGCLPKLTRDEILKATVQRENGAEDPDYEKRRALAWDETTEYLCNACLRGGICMQCQEPVHTEDPPEIKPEEVAPKPADDQPEVIDLATSPGPTSQAEATASSEPPPPSGPEAATIKPDEIRPDDKQLLFRCFTCKRPSHYDHLEALEDGDSEDPVDVALSYQDTWQCQDCRRWEYPLDRILAWRPTPGGKEPPRLSNGTLDYRAALPREYLVKWEKRSYRHLEWVPHQWLLSTNMAKLRHFLNKGTRIHLVRPDHPAVVEAVKALPSGETLLAAALIASNPPSKAHTPMPSNATKSRDVSKGVDADENEDEELPEGEPVANPVADFCIPQAWKTIDRLLDVVFLKPLKKPSASKKKNAKKVKSKQKRRIASDEEDDEIEIIEDSEVEDPNDDRRKSLIFGEAPDASLTETMNEREDRKDLTPADIKDVIWCFVKWDDLTHEDGMWL